MTSKPIPLQRVGFCVCGVPVVDHFGSRNESLECDVARRRWEGRLDVERSHVALIETCLATVLLARSGRVPTTASPLETLTEADRRMVMLLAQAALTGLDPVRRRIARERGIAAGTETFRKTTGHRELPQKMAYQMRDVLFDALNAFDCTLQNLTPISEAELAAAKERGW